MHVIYIDIFLSITTVKTYRLYTQYNLIIMIDVGHLNNTRTLLTAIRKRIDAFIVYCYSYIIYKFMTTISRAVYSLVYRRNVNDECYAMTGGEKEQQK